MQRWSLQTFTRQTKFYFIIYSFDGRVTIPNMKLHDKSGKFGNRNKDQTFILKTLFLHNQTYVEIIFSSCIWREISLCTIKQPYSQELRLQ